MQKILNTLRRKSATELRDRARQGASVLAELFGMSAGSRMLSDLSLLKTLRIENASANRQQVLEHFRSRTSPAFYPSTWAPEKTIAVLRSRFPEQESRIVSAAEKICEGFFDLLGYKDLYFGGRIPDWHFDPVSRSFSPKIHWSRINEISAEQTGDKKIIWELNRHQYFITLGQAYWLTRDEKYAAVWGEHLDGWMSANPPKLGVNWLSSLELSFRSMSWIWSIYFFKDSPRFTSDLLVRMLKYLHLNARHIETYLSTYFSPNTHLTGEALGLYFLGVFLPEFPEANRWKETGYRILLNALDFQVRPDGSYCEQSSHYHRYTTDFYLNLLILRNLEGSAVDPKHSEKLNQLLDFLMHITQPNGETSLFGDDDGGRLHFLDKRDISDFRPTVAVGAAVTRRGDLKFVSGEEAEELLWLLGPDGLETFDGIAAVEPAVRSRPFMNGGFFTIRSSWRNDADFMLVHCGPHGFLNGGHAHADALSFVLSVGGGPVFVDSGTFCYTSDLSARTLFRSSGAHNCLSVNGESSSVPGGPFSWKSATDSELVDWVVDDAMVRFRGSHEGFRRFDVRYQREILFGIGGNLTLTDYVDSNQPNEYEFSLILSRDLDVRIQPNAGSVSILRGGEPILIIRTETSGDGNAPNGKWRVTECEVSDTYGSKVKSKKLIFAVKAVGSFQVQNHFTRPAAFVS